MSNRLLAYPNQAVGNRAPVWPFRRDARSWQARGLEAWWPMAPARGATLYDLSGRGRHATLAGGVTWDATAYGKHAPHFNGSSGYASADATPFGFTSWDEITVCAWIDSDVGADSTTHDIIGWWYYNGGAGNRSWVMTHHGNNQYFFEIAGKNVVTGGTKTANRDFVVATYSDRAGEMRLYVNGVQVATQGGVSGNLPGSEGPVYFATQHDGGNFFDGLIEEARIYRRALSAAEVWALYDPQSRWALYEELRTPRVWPTAGGAATQTLSGSLDAAARKQILIAAGLNAGVAAELTRTASAEAALQAVRAAQTALDTAIERALTADIAADGVIRAARSLSMSAEAALAAAMAMAASLDASVTGAGVGLRGAALDAAVERLLSLAASLNAAVARLRSLQSGLDAGLAVSGARSAALDGAVERLDILAGLAIEAAVRQSADLSAVLDAVVGTVVAPGATRTFHIPARGGHAVAGDPRTLVIPGGNRRH